VSTITKPEQKADSRVSKQQLLIVSAFVDYDDNPMGMKHVFLWFLCALNFVASAQETGQQVSTLNIVPADMHPGVDPWGGAIEFPAGSDDVEVVLRCKGRITETGQLENIYCDIARFMADQYIVNDPEDRPYVYAIYRTADAVRVTPATIDGQQRDVTTVFSFVFARENGNETITLFQNQLLNRDQFDPNYLAPQIYEREQPGLRFCIMPIHDALRYRVQIDGTADVTVIPQTDRRQDCVERSVNHQGFIPAQLRGQPIEAAMVIIRGQPDRPWREPNWRAWGDDSPSRPSSPSD